MEVKSLLEIVLVNLHEKYIEEKQQEEDDILNYI